MEEDDMDFTPSPNTSSNLASLFGFTRKPLQGNSSLTYTAPKAPKGESAPTKKPPDEKAKGKIIFSKAVHAYKLENRTYVSWGLIGIVISGNHDSRIYEIILYKRTKEHLSQCRISNSFSITLSLNNYVSFYDSNHQNWSLMFQTPADAEQFSQKVAICKFYSEQKPPADALIQDLTPCSQQKANINSTVDVIYTGYALSPEEISKLKEDIKERMKLSTYSFVYLSKSLIGCGEKCKRAVIIPHSLGGPWVNDLNPNKDLLLEVKLERIVPETAKGTTESKVLKEGTKSPADSSAEESSVKARGASIKEALSSTKSQKANLISRMARMGQATLPVKPGLSPGQSDSEEENPVASSPKPRIPRSRVTASTPPVNSSFSQTPGSAEASQLVSLYQQNDLSWHQSQKPGVVYQQLVPVSASQVSSPTTDPSLSMYVSESRIQAAELRMGISKISEKLDAIWSKMQGMSGIGSEGRACQAALTDSAGILASIQNLITENENLKGKVEEQKGKIEQQNDRIFHLLELNHKYLEQNSTTHEKQSANESKLRTEMESLQKKEQELEASNRKALDRVKSLTEEIAQSEETNKELRKRLEESNAETEALRKDLEGSQDSQRKEVESFREKLSKASETTSRLEDRLRELVSENESLKSLVRVQKEEIETGNREMKDSEAQKKEYERAVESLKKQMLDEEKTDSKVCQSLSKVVARLEEENKSLLEKLEKQDNRDGGKGLLPQMLSVLKGEFPDSREYTSSHIISTVEAVFKRVVDGTFEPAETSEAAAVPEAPAAKPEVVPAPRKSLLNVEAPRNEKEERERAKEAEEGSSANEPEAKEEEKSETDDQQKKEETDSRYKSYDQGWRTTKPPPPPLFDDEDDDEDDWLN